MHLFADDSKVYRIINNEDDENNFNMTLICYSNGVKIGKFVFILKNVRFYVLPMREILLAILASYLVVRFSLSMKLLIWGFY